MITKEEILEEPKTVCDLEDGDGCWMLDLDLEPLKIEWSGTPYDIRLRELGRIYLTKEELEVIGHILSNPMCENCEHTGEHTTPIYYVDYRGERTFYLATGDSYYDADIKYCPFCGRKLEKK